STILSTTDSILPFTEAGGGRGDISLPVKRISAAHRLSSFKEPAGNFRAHIFLRLFFPSNQPGNFSYVVSGDNGDLCGIFVFFDRRGKPGRTVLLHYPARPSCTSNRLLPDLLYGSILPAPSQLLTVASFLDCSRFFYQRDRGNSPVDYCYAWLFYSDFCESQY